jgi:hypothetical protein
MLISRWRPTKSQVPHEYGLHWWPEVKNELSRRCREFGLNASTRALLCIEQYNISRKTLFSEMDGYYWLMPEAVRDKDFLGCNMSHCRS